MFQSRFECFDCSLANVIDGQNIQHSFINYYNGSSKINAPFNGCIQCGARVQMLRLKCIITPSEYLQYTRTNRRLYTDHYRHVSCWVYLAVSPSPYAHSLSVLDVFACMPGCFRP